jgi:tetratricopeptide (TPR) repeat protein
LPLNPRMKPLLAILILLYTSVQLTAQTKQEYYDKALELYDKENYKSALQQINLALRLDSVNLDYLFLKGNTLTSLKQYKEAYATFSRIIDITPHYAWAWNQRGLMLNTIQEFEYAIKDFTEGLKLSNPDSIQVSLYLNRGSAKINIRDFQGAYNDFKEAYKLDPTNIGVLNNLAAVCDEVGKGDSTLIFLNRILQIDSTFIGAYGNIGFKYQEMGDYTTAIKYFDKVLTLEPNEPLAFNNRAYNKYKQGDLKGALADVEKSLRLYPTNSYAFRNRALIYLAMKKNANACQDINKALELGFTTMYGDQMEKLKEEHCVKGKL